MARILIIDDEAEMVEVISKLCRTRGHQPIPLSAPESALEVLRKVLPQLVIVDVKMEKVGGFDILRECSENLPQTVVVMITAHASVETAVEAMKLGAYDYLTKPFKLEELELWIQLALSYQAALKENSYLKRGLGNRYQFENLVGTSARMQEIYKLIGKIADTDITVLIQGEGGTGKQLLVRALHYNSSRQHHPLVSVNCSAIPENLLDSELFGHKKGAFATAITDKVGSFEEANHGTLFIDEIDSMSLQLQTRLLRALQERNIQKIGDSGLIPINVRVVAASDEPLRAKVRNGSFREDLYYRLAVVPIEIPPLRERLEDVPLLVNYFIQKIATQTGNEIKQVEAKAMDRLKRYTWPGNVREMESALERACALSEDGMLKLADLPPQIVQESNDLERSVEWQMGQNLDEFVRNLERRYIEMTLKFNQGSREKTASMLGISIATLYRKLDLKHHKS